MKNKIDDRLLDAMRTDPDNWKWIFYVNNKDPRLIVPKMQKSMGWTINFGNTYAVIGMVLIVAIAIGTQLI